MGLRDTLDRRVTHRHVLIAGWIVFLMYCFPGYMSFDSGVQLEQARGLQPMTNWHPPIMAVLWRVCDSIIAGPFLMLVIQSVTLLAGMYLILGRVMSKRGAAIAAVLVLLSPPVIPNMAVIWKDSQMAGFLMLGIAFMLKQTRGWLLAGCVLVWFGTAQRHNAVAATLPIFVFLFVWKDGLARWKRYTLAVAVWLGIWVSTIFVNNWLTDQKEDVFSSLLMNDLVGVIYFQKDYTDDQIRADAPGLPWKVEGGLAEAARKLYRPTITFLDVCGDQGVFRYPKTAEESAAVSRAWRTMVLKYPAAYLRHRWKTFLAELRVIRRSNFYIWWGIVDYPTRSATLGHYAKHSDLQHLLFYSLVWLTDTPIYWAWVYYLLGFILVWLCRRDKAALTVVLSGVACESGLFIAAPAIDYRYSHYMVTCTVLAAVYYVAMRRKARREEGQAR